jgi:ACS family tartrate transporter-like MFS transporter
MTRDPVAASARRKAYLHVVLPLFVASTIAYLDRVNISYAALTMNAALGFDARVFGLGAGIFFAGYILFEIPGALVAERYGPRRWLARIMISWGLVSGLMAFMTTATQFYALRFLLGAAEASLYPVIFASSIPRFFPSAERARAIAFLLASLQVSGVVGAPLAGWLTTVELFGFQGWQVLFLVEAVPAILFGVVLLFWMAESPREAGWLTPEEQEHLARQYEEERAAQAAIRRYSLLDALSDREVLKLSLTYFLWVTGFWGFNYWTPTVLKEVSGWSNVAIGRVIALAMLVSLAAALYTGHSSSKRGEKRWHGAFHMFLAAVGMAGGACAGNAWLFCGFMVLAAVGTYAPMAVWWSYPSTFLSGMAAAGAMGLINSLGNLGGFVGPYVTGFVRQTTGSFSLAMLYLAASLTAAGLLILTLRRTRPQPSEVIS